ncbi:hypothetical protein EW146_g2234 [Bondarzewia mesenterica]|uniref:FAD-binding PCMH-type domain-containing protein n=1 Tax=Bondarzewia mesenterica TaxID=1095465 RepID=A0A4S4M1S7_9AGAM|nr:hypothetical protein EW146_g2234 [Bondarzewia mesenterica]
MLFSQIETAFLLLATLSAAQDLTSWSLKDTLATEGVYALFPDDAEYVNASLAYNRRFILSPVAIAYPTEEEQVSKVVKAGAERDLRVVARSGGHSYIASGLGGRNGSLVIDMSMMKDLSFDAESGNVMIEPGLRLGDISLALNSEERALPHGRCTFIGIGGHAGHGGFGMSSRMWGLTLDRMISVNVVLANGSIATASKDVNTELFWAIRGAASSFGIVTSYIFQTLPAPASAAAFVYTWELDIVDATHALYAFQTFVESGITAEFGGELYLTRGSSAGSITVRFLGGYYGPLDSFNATLAPYLDELPAPLATNVTAGSWLTALEADDYGPLNTTSDPTFVDHDTFYAKSLMTPEDSPMSEAAITALMTYLVNNGSATDLNWFVEIELYGGSNSAINAVPLNDTAFARRSSLFNMQLYASAPNFMPPYPDEGFSFLDGIATSILSNSPADWDYGAYLNYPDDRLSDWQMMYYGGHYDRLRDLKRSVDPMDVFDFPISIEE